MSYKFLVIGFSLLFTPLVVVAALQDVRTEKYYTLGGWGMLSVVREKDNALKFEIGTIGTNGHTCSLSGYIKNGIGINYQEGIEPQPELQCRISFVDKEDAVAVGGLDDACHQYYCGMRARFDGTYVRPTLQCQTANRQIRRDEFLTKYRAHDYLSALEVIGALSRECGELLHWMDADDIRNDIAVTHYHLGRGQDCLQTLAKTVAAKYPSVNELKKALPPLDFISYEPIALAAWHNLELCRGFPSGKSR